MQLLGVEHRESDGGSGILQQRFVGGVSGGRSLVVRQLAAASDMANEAGAQRNAASERAAARAGFGLHHEFARGIFQHADAYVVVGQAGLELLRDLGQHFVRVKSRDRIARNCVE